jgi:hypothetical protein
MSHVQVVQQQGSSRPRSQSQKKRGATSMEWQSIPCGTYGKNAIAEPLTTSTLQPLKWLSAPRKTENNIEGLLQLHIDSSHFGSGTHPFLEFVPLWPVGHLRWP